MQLRLVFIINVMLVSLAGAARAQQDTEGFALVPDSGDIETLQVIDKRMRDQNDNDMVYDIRVFCWLPDQPNGTTILYNHGFQSHSAWFFSTAESLKKRGFSVYAFDRIGSGQSDPGAGRSMGRYFAAPGHISRWRLFVKTLDEVVAWVRTERPDDQLVVWGNSYGAKIVTAWLHEIKDESRDDTVTTAIFTTPGLYQNKESMPLPFSIVRLLFSGTQKRFPLPMVERDGDNGAAWFIGPGPWFDAIRNDELSLRDVTKRFYLQTGLMDRNITSQRNNRYYTPAFFLMVRGDVLMDNDRLEDDIHDRAENGYYKYYSGGPLRKHFLMFTEDRDEVVDDIVKFIAGRRDDIAGLETRQSERSE